MIRQLRFWMNTLGTPSARLTTEGARPRTVRKETPTTTQANYWLRTSQEEGRVTVTLLKIQGNLDSSTYEAVIAKGHELVRAGAQHLLVDLRSVAALSNSGLVALHHLAKLINGEHLPSIEDGWGALHTMAWDRQNTSQKRVKLLNPQPQVARVLSLTGMDQYFEIYTDQIAAVDSF